MLAVGTDFINFGTCVFLSEIHFAIEVLLLVGTTACFISGRYQAGVCAMDGLVFAAGGCDAWNCLSSVEVYDPQTDVWTYAKGMITARRGCGLAVFRGTLLVST